jgi:hypothetical protein
MKTASPSRTYIAMCNKSNFSGFYFRRFTLPMTKEVWITAVDKGEVEVENSVEHASWFFLNVLNFEACLEMCFPAEDLGAAADLVEKERRSV